MKRVILTVGPQGSGKSTFCEGIAAAYPDIIIVSRDAILLEMFGSVWLSPHTGEHYAGKEKMWKILSKHLTCDSATVILDCWNGSADERLAITNKLRELGANKIEAWRFTTPEETCVAFGS